jgi:hypothetical protein
MHAYIHTFHNHRDLALNHKSSGLNLTNTLVDNGCCRSDVPQEQSPGDPALQIGTACSDYVMPNGVGPESDREQCSPPVSTHEQRVTAFPHDCKLERLGHPNCAHVSHQLACCSPAGNSIS